MNQDEINTLLATSRPLIAAIFTVLATFGIVGAAQEVTAVNLTMLVLGAAVPVAMVIWSYISKRNAIQTGKDTTRVAVAQATGVSVSQVSPDVHTNAAAAVATMDADGGVPEHKG